MKQNSTRRGFTLIELLVVVLIIGILAAIALPQYNKAVELTEAKMIIANLHAIKRAEQLYYLAHGTYTKNWEELDVILSAKKISQSKTTLYTQDGQEYDLSSEGTYNHVSGYSHDGKYNLYLSFSSNTQLCYPRGTDKGKRVCRYLGCAEDTLDSMYCSFQWKP